MKIPAQWTRDAFRVWSVDAYLIASGMGSNVWLIDNENGTWSVVRRSVDDSSEEECYNTIFTGTKAEAVKRGKATRKTNPAGLSEWVLLGSCVAVQDAEKSVDLSGYVLVVDASGDLQLVIPTKRKLRKRASKAAKAEWRRRTLLDAKKKTFGAVQPSNGPWKRFATIRAIDYTGTLQGKTADYRHDFKNRYPVLYSGPEGFKIARNGSKYTVSERGIIG